MNIKKLEKELAALWSCRRGAERRNLRYLITEIRDKVELDPDVLNGYSAESYIADIVALRFPRERNNRDSV